MQLEVPLSVVRPSKTRLETGRGDRLRLVSAIVGLLVALASVAAAEPVERAEWPHPGGDAGGARFSPLAEIDRTNVDSLRVAWTYRHGDAHVPEDPGRVAGTAFEATPLMVDGKLIVSTPYNRVIALDAETGAELWIFDPRVDRTLRYTNGYLNRGVESWRDPHAKGFCTARLFVATIDSRLIALDLTSGRVCPGFGKGGTVDLHVGIENLLRPEHHKMTSPPVAVGDTVVVGSSLADNRRVQPSGDVRGFDARTGRLRWRFHVIPREGEFGVETWGEGSWRRGAGANAWAPLSADTARGLVFIPTSSASPDFYGGARPGDNLFADSLVVLRAETGERVWHFQTVHHDLWDYDNASQPLLVTLERDGAATDVAAQLTKTGFVFLFDRETGEPFFPIEERRVPRSDVPGEHASPTQPFPSAPPPLSPVHALTRDDLWARTPEHVEACAQKLAGLRNEGIFTPPSEKGSVLYPAIAGGANWPGGAVDRRTGILYVPVTNIAMVTTLPLLPDVLRRSVFAGLLPGHRRVAKAAAEKIEPRGGGPFRVNGQPCLKPPWGMLVAVDLARGKILWRVAAGKTPDGVDGAAGFGPALVTAGGLVFHGGTSVPELRAHDADTGEVLASIELPASLNAGPISYRVRPGGKQFLVVTPGGHHLYARYQGAQMGDYVIAYTLPD
ncbi:MAG: pyrroloquinoline quinone-dependent dehydrogenase [Deltaproteobacteria bacterium]|nr:pyrroloquinoline quinone-dependent dehydrogenase [Deltaproteobacteria bacterium]